MKTVNNYKEVGKGIYQLKVLNSKKEWANINTNTGMILYSANTGAKVPMPLSKMTIKRFETELSKGNARWLNKDYEAWRIKYPEVYNTMIDKINNLEIAQ